MSGTVPTPNPWNNNGNDISVVIAKPFSTDFNDAFGPISVVPKPKPGAPNPWNNYHVNDLWSTAI